MSAQLAETAEQTKDLRDFLYGLRRRAKLVAWIVGGLSVISALVAWLLPPVYESKATILVEEQDIPVDLVRSTITTVAWQRLQTINQRVMTRTNLLEIADKHGLYTNKRRRETTEEIVERVRKDIKLEPISADVIDPRSGRPMPATIAFTVAYEYESPEVAQKVANELVSLYLNENVKTRTERATETFDFLTDETKKVEEQIKALNEKLAIFREKNIENLPDQMQLNRDFLQRTETELTNKIAEIRQIEAQIALFEGQLVGLSPMKERFTATGERMTLDPVARLRDRKSEYASALAKYSPDHPDVIRLAREIEGLEKEVGSSSDSREEARRLTNLRGELAAAQKKYSDDHPDVGRLKHEIAALETALRDTPEVEVATLKPDNEVYVQISSNIESRKVELRAAQSQRDELRRKLAYYEQRIAATPAAQREYSDLARDLDAAQVRYQNLKAKQLEAGIGQELEKERKGERFTLIEPPALPEQPIRPNRWAIMVLGLVLSLGGGFGYAAVAESMDSSVRSARGVTATFGIAPLSVIPYIENSEDIARRGRTRKQLMRAAIAAVVVVVLLIQFFWIPWDVLWFKGLRFLGMGGG
jgi:uncharacterized protein involved in exopolysaccharide biosynthesis